MKKITTKKSVIGFSLISLLLAIVLHLGFSSCTDPMQGKTFLTSDEVMIDEYVTNTDTSMTNFLSMIENVGLFGMIHAYGTYTCFFPTNSAVSAYAKKKGYTSWESIPSDEMLKLVKFHIVADTIMTSDFVDGRLSSETLLGKYLTTKTETTTTGTGIRVNRQGLITDKDISCANGYINKIDQMLTPNDSTIGEEITNLPDTYSIFKSVMEQTGWIDSLSTTTDDVWSTVFLQSDASLASVGIYSTADLKTYLATEIPEVSSDSLLWTYAAYHCTSGLHYVADLTLLSSLLTKATNQTMTFSLSGDSLLVNEYNNDATETYESGIAVDKDSYYTDFSCANGVLVDMSGYIGPKTRAAAAVYWDIAEQPEIMANANFRVKGTYTSIPISSLSEMTFNVRVSAYTAITYGCVSSYAANGQYANYDYLDINFNRITSIAMKTPTLTAGTYYVWLCWRRAGYGDKIRATFQQDGQDDQQMENIINLADYEDITTASATLLASGMKRYTAKTRSTVMVSELMGTIQVTSTGRHTLLLESLNQAKAASVYLDMIQFIPVDNNQLWPRFDMGGNKIYSGTDCEDIVPSTTSCSANNDDY